ncbi:MAG: hypothetical protein A2Y33_09875 [Spirochaetes bacterium GWF1_51_8]|nr:MAG: hypothetical protein A2Y33_09875 [Spirochaetes bacterium GWF1_51_8]
MNAVELRSIHKSFKQNKVLSSIDLDVMNGGITAIAGPNGAGKTTTLKIISGYYYFDGSCSLFGDVTPVTPNNKGMDNIFYVPEEKGLPGGQKVSTFFSNSSLLYSKHKIDHAKLGAMLKHLGLDKKLNSPIKEISMGMRSSLYLLLALSSSAKLLVLDEPMTGLDPFIRSRMITLMKEFVLDGNKAIIYSSHILEEIEEAADRIVILNNGQSIYSGTIDELKDRYSEAVIEKPAMNPSVYNLPGVVFVREENGLYHLFVENKLWKGLSSSKQYPLRLREIFINLIEKSMISQGEANEFNQSS